VPYHYDTACPPADSFTQHKKVDALTAAESKFTDVIESYSLSAVVPIVKQLSQSRCTAPNLKPEVKSFSNLNNV
jgi:hypothetical protein